eukprot:scaffold5061_cov378-Prasinococcus_capsulatus_cf.AAC.17
MRAAVAARAAAAGESATCARSRSRSPGARSGLAVRGWRVLVRRYARTLWSLQLPSRPPFQFQLSRQCSARVCKAPCSDSTSQILEGLEANNNQLPREIPAIVCGPGT